MSLNYLIPFVAYVAIASPAAYKAVRGVLGCWVASDDGLPTTAGLLLHALVFVIVAHFLWRLIYGKKKSSYSGVMSMATTGLDGDGQYMASNARAIQGQQMHPADFDDGADCQ